MVDVASKLRELFSVVEASKGDLTVLIRRTGGESPLFGPESTPVVEHRFSIHVSPNAHGNTFSQTRRLANGIIRKTSAFVVPVDGYTIWPVYAFRLPALIGDLCAIQPKSKDKILSIGSFDPAISNLFYGVLAVSPNAPNMPPPFPSVSVRRIEFATFHIVLFHTFMNVRSLNNGHFTWFGTSEETENGALPKRRIEGGAPSFTPEKMVEFLGHFLYLRVPFVYAEQVAALRAQSGIPMSEPEKTFIARRAQEYSKTPALVRA